MKRLFLTCDQTFGCFSLSFKVFFVTNGLMNFADHYCNKHDNCNRFIWWGTCTKGVQYYQPIHSYCTEVSSNRGPRCNSLIPRIFRLLVAAFTYSNYMEAALWRSVSMLPQ
mmetsp:Transcript_18670/g.41700  ORF Transcript_18670/g.41700 Transcript_18670/m.41700 type:complete len:111 (+) Transcript_18670:1840-2172(+)